MTLAVFFARFFLFTFHESPKFLLGRGREQAAIDVLHRIAAFNGAPPPTLTVEHFRAIDAELGRAPPAPVSARASFGTAVKAMLGSFTHLKGLFTNRLQLFIFVLLAVAYMVCAPARTRRTAC
jgi:hypothetical protein